MTTTQIIALCLICALYFVSESLVLEMAIFIWEVWNRK